jgi:hypothetical protein
MLDYKIEIAKYPEKLGHYLGYPDLTEIHREWIIKTWKSKKDYVLQAHRNSYKTTAVLIVGTIWYMLYNPNDTVLILRKAFTDATSIIKSIIRHYESEKMIKLYENVFGVKNFKLVEDRKDCIVLPTKINVTKEGSIDALGIGGSITGRHYKKIMADDIITVKDRLSKAERENTKEFIRELENIKTTDGSITFTGTPWHREDGFSMLPEAEKFPIDSIDIKGFTKEKLEDIRKRTTASLFAANYLLKHVSDENRVFKDIKYAQWEPGASYKIAHIDAAYSGKHYTSLTLLQEWHGKYTLKGYIWRQSIVDLFDKIVTIMKNHGIGSVYLEDNADKGLSKKELMKIWNSVIGYHEKENKHNRIIGYLKYYWPEVYFDMDSDEDYLSQILDYEEGEEPDDAPDSATGAVRVATKRAGGIEPIVKETYKEYEY